MKILFNQEIMGLDDKAIKDETQNVFTLKKAVLTALVSNFEDERTLSGEEKLKRWELALKIKNASDPVSLTVEDVAEIKKLVGKLYGTLVVGQAYKMLENTN